MSLHKAENFLSGVPAVTQSGIGSGAAEVFEGVLCLGSQAAMVGPFTARAKSRKCCASSPVRAVSTEVLKCG